MGYKVIITGPGIAQEALQMLRTKHMEPTMVSPETGHGELVDLIGAAQPDALIIRTNQINEAVINASENLKIIVKHGVGVNNIDIDAATRRGIPVAITRAANARSVAEHALTLILTLVKDVLRFNTGIRAGKWERAGYKGQELSGKRLGLIGMGSISRELINLLGPFGMDISYYDPYAGDEVPGITREKSLISMLSGIDVLSIHCPLTPETKNLIGLEELRAMKPTAFIVNTARGGIIDEPALSQSLQENELAGAGLDSFEQEPPSPDNPLWALPNVILTAHIAGSTEEAMVRMGTTAANHVIGFLQNALVDLDSVLNSQVLEKIQKNND